MPHTHRTFHTLAVAGGAAVIHTHHSRKSTVFVELGREKLELFRHLGRSRSRLEVGATQKCSWREFRM